MRAFTDELVSTLLNINNIVNAFPYEGKIEIGNYPALIIASVALSFSKWR